MKDYLNQMNGYISDDINTFSGGLNTYMDKAFIEPEQVSYALNMGMYQPPMMCTRPSRETLFIDTQATGKDVVSMWAWDEEHIFYIVRNRTSPYEQELYTAQFIIDSQSPNGRWDFYDFRGANLPDGEDLYFCYCRTTTTEYLYVVNPNYKGKFELNTSAQQMINTYQRIQDSHYGIPAWHKARLFLAEPSKGLITYSAAMDYDNFTEVPPGADPLDIDYSSYAGDFMVTNSKGYIQMITSFDDKLVIFCQHSMHLLYGDTPLLTSQNQYQLVDMNNNLGCAAPKSVAIGGGQLFWFGDDKEVYSYDGAYIDMISRPAINKRVQRHGGISNLPFIGGAEVFATATSSKYYIRLQLYIDEHTTGDFLFVYDTFNKIWWCEDGGINSIANFSLGIDGVVMSPWNPVCVEVVKQQNKYTGKDRVYDIRTGEIKDISIEYEFHTKVYAADGLNSRKSISKLWLQASANADVYITDSWTSTNHWQRPLNTQSLKLIGTLGYKGQKEMTSDYLDTYDQDDYEQQECIVPKMYGQRLNTFQVVVKGIGSAKFYLMKRDWCAR